jgi:hypothetical protein
MNEQRIASAPAKELFARIGDEAALVAQHLDELLLAYNSRREVKFLTELGLAQKHHTKVTEALRLLSQGRVIEAEVLMNGLNK